MTNDDELFAGDFLARLERLRLRVRKVLPGRLRADRRSRRTGSSMEFADYRNYAAGDDPRRIDWNIYGRLGRLMTKLYEEEDDLEAAILIDCSRSMRWALRPGAPAAKLDLARRLAAALAYLALQGLDRVGLWYFDTRLRAESGVFRGRKAFYDLMRFLRKVPETGTGTDLLESLGRFARSRRRPGLAIVLSDCLDPAGFERGLAAVAGRHFALHLIHVMDPAEENPANAGDLVLRDCESGDEMMVTANAALMNAYRREVQRFQDEIKAWCARNDCGYSLAFAGAAFEELVLRLFRKDGLLR